MYENDGFHPYEDNNDAQNRYEAQSSETSGNQWQQPLYQMPQQPEHTQPKKKHTAGRVVALALCCSLLGGAVGAGAMAIGTSMTGSSGGSRSSSTSTILQGDRPTSAINVSKIDTSKEMTAAEVYAANVNSTVGITTSITTNYWGYQTTAAASGSGFILTADGYILTNYHVIENSNSVKVTMYDGTSYDESNDIAVLKIDATGLTPVVLGDSDELNVGDSVVAIGNPLGELTFSLTSGAVSALNREVTLSSNVTMDLIQTDCAINSGNSGGALFNLYGEVIGITNAKYSSSGSSNEASIDNIGFAIPINSVRSIVESIIKNGYIVKPYIGVSVEDVSSEMTSYGRRGRRRDHRQQRFGPDCHRQEGGRHAEAFRLPSGPDTGADRYRCRAEAVRAGRLKRYTAEPAAGSEPAAATAGRRLRLPVGLRLRRLIAAKSIYQYSLFSFFLS